MSTLKLRNLTEATNKMLASIIHVSTNNRIENLKNDLEKIRRRCHIMSLLYDKNIISVAGLQGVGKSTLMSELYDFDKENTPFLENQGQGETLPILVTESETPGKYFVHNVNEEGGLFQIKKKEINNKQEFKDLSHKYSQNDLFLEVTVPYKVFNSDSKSFLLLPGFQNTGDYLKELTFSALRSSINCLILFYQTKYAHKNNLELINTLRDEFKDSSPIMVVTWSDNEDSNIDLVEKIKTDLRIEESDRVVRTGIPGPKKWKESLIKAIRNYDLPKSHMIEIKKKNLKELVLNYNSIISQIQTELRNADVDKSNREYEQVDRLIKVIQEEKEKIRESLKENLENTYSSYFGNIEREIQKQIVDKYKGLEGFGKNLSEFFKNNTEIRHEFNKLIESCIEKGNNNTINDEYLIVLNRIINETMNAHQIVSGLPQEQNKKYDKQLLLCGSKEGQREISSSTLNDVFLILNPDRTDKKFSDNLLFSVKLLPVLALESYRMSKILVDKNRPLNIVFDEQKDLIQLYKENMREVGIGVGILFGLDIIEGDGIDLFGLLQHNATSASVMASETSTSVMASATFNWALASIAGVAILVYVNDQLKKSVDKKEHAARLVIQHLKNYTIEKLLSEFDNRMGRFEDIIHDCLIRRYGLAKEYAAIQNCHMSLENLKNTNREIEELARWEIEELK